MSDTKPDGFFSRILDDETASGLRARLVRAGRRMRANGSELKQILRRRNGRAGRTVAPRPAGHSRPQDLLAVLLLTVGIAVIALDRPSYPWVHSLPREYAEFFRAITDIGKSHWILWSTGLYLLVTMALDWRHFAFRVRLSLSLIWIYCAFIFFTVASSGVIALVLKWSLGRPRPKLFETVGPLGFDFLAFNISYTSFPSGHATTVGALAASLCLIFPAWLWLITVCGFWLIVSRIMVGAHYPSDVIAGTVLGISVTLWTARYMAIRRLGFTIVPGEGIRPIASGRTLRRALATLGRTVAHARLFGGERLEPVRPEHNETQSDDR